MSIRFVLLPLFVEVLLTFGLLFVLARLRGQAVTSGAVDLQRVALREPLWPAPAMQVAYSFSNQFELPVLFYVLTILSIITKHADLLFVLLSWVFVVTRMGHAYVHCTSNIVMRRGLVYGAGMLVLFIMWIIFILRILLALP